MNSVTIPSSHDRDSRSPIFFTNYVFMMLKLAVILSVSKSIKCLTQEIPFFSMLCSTEEKIRF